MANGDDPSLEELQRQNPGYKAAPAGAAAPGVSAKQQLEEQRPGITASSQFGGPSSPLVDQLARPLLMGADQAAIGLAGLGMTPLHYVAKGLNLLDPQDFGEPPKWMEASGPGSYGEAMTPSWLEPSNEAERAMAAGARTTGAVLPFAMTGLGLPAALTAIGGSVVGHEFGEHGHPNIGAAIDVGSNLLAGRTYQPRLPAFTQTWTNVAPTAAQSAAAAAQAARDAAAARAAASAAQEARDVRNLRNMAIFEPMTHRMPFGTGIFVNMAMVGASGATTLAKNILGIGPRMMRSPGTYAGAELGGAAYERGPSPDPAMSYKMVGMTPNNQLAPPQGISSP